MTSFMFGLYVYKSRKPKIWEFRMGRSVLISTPNEDEEPEAEMVEEVEDDGEEDDLEINDVILGHLEV